MRRRQNRGRNDRESPTGRLRIVAGKWRSRLLPVADEPGLRPTSERIRETAFNWLTPSIDGSRCLDLFAGTGALGFEALSRGAAEVVFVESSLRASRMLEESAGMLAAAGAVIRYGNAFEYLEGEPQAFDIVFLDPPFATDLLVDLCRLLHEGGWLAGNARVYLEQSRDRPLPGLPAGWTLVSEKTAGRVRYALVTVAI